MTELLSCPFCGGKAETDATSVSEFYGHEHQDYTIECTKCGADMTVYTSSNKDGTPSKGYEFGCSCCNDIPAAAREKWNTRHQQSTPAGYVMVPVKPTPEMLDCIMDWQKIGNVTAYRAMLAAAPKAEQPPVQEPARNPDVLALNAAREIMGLVYGPTLLGRSTQLLAQIQCVVSEAIVYAAPQPVSDDARDALAVALDALIADYDGEIHNEYDGTNNLDSRLSKINYAREALAAYRAAMESK